MRKFLIDITYLLEQKKTNSLPTGILRVELEYVRHFKSRSTALIRFLGGWFELSPNDSQEIFDYLLDPITKHQHSIFLKILKNAPRTILKLFPKHRVLLNMGYSGLREYSYARKIRSLGLKPFFCIHDLIAFSHPEYFRPGEARKHKQRLNTIIHTACGVIAVSTIVASELGAYVKAENLTLPPFAVAPLAPARLPEPAIDSFLDKPYFVMLGTIEPRKNHWLMLQLWKQLISCFGNATPRLVIIGARGWECENVVALLDRNSSLKDFIIECSSCGDKELSTWLKHARALLFPTFMEGYGMPLVEALAHGTPVIASDLPVFREIAGEIPDYVDPLNTKRWGELIMNFAQSTSQQRLAQCARMTNFKVPTWDEHFSKIEAFMENLHV